MKMKKIFLAALIIIALSVNAQRTTSGNQKIPAKKPNSLPVKIIASVLKPLESLSDTQIANALYVEIGFDEGDGVSEVNTLEEYMSSNSKVVNIAEIIHLGKKFFLVDRLCGNDCPDGNNRDSYEDKGNLRSTVINSTYSGSYVDHGSWVSNINQEEVNKFRVSSRDKDTIQLVSSNINITCKKEGDSFVETLRIGQDLISQYFIKGTHSYILSVDRSGKVTNIKSQDQTNNNSPTINYNIRSERIVDKIEDFKFIDDLDAPLSRSYEVTVTSKIKNANSGVNKFVYNNHTYLSNSDFSRKFYNDSIKIESQMNDALRNFKLIESKSDSLYKNLKKNRDRIIQEFKTNYAAYIEKDRQRLLKEEWGGKLDPRTTSYESSLEMILAQASANTKENFGKLEIATERNISKEMESVRDNYIRLKEIYIGLKDKYQSFENYNKRLLNHHY